MRKKVLPLLLLIIILTLSCNFPLDLNAYQPRQYPTLDPAIFTAHRTPAAVNTAPAPPGTSSGPFPTAVNPSLYITYPAQSGDTLAVVARHFDVTPDQIYASDELPSEGLLRPGQVLVISRNAGNTAYRDPILPDSAVIYSSCADDLNLFDFVSNAGGYLNYHQQKAGEDILTGAQIVQRVAQNTSVDPRLLLAFTEFRSQWVYRYTSNPQATYPLGLNIRNYEGFYLELAVAARYINTGYYAWRQGQLTEVTFTDQGSARIAPNLNAGSAGIIYLFSRLYPLSDWESMLYGQGGFLSVYYSMFGDPWVCAARVEPLFTDQVQPPQLELPFATGELWSLTGGLHPDWNDGTPFGALDFAPITKELRCAVSHAWVRASAPGTVVRSSNSVVVLALEDEQQQPNGWEVMYMHIAEQDSARVGKRLAQDDPIGHPSCEGGAATGTHVHITRKYRGEWIGSGNPFPFVLSGWTAFPGEAIFRSTLVKGASVVTARPDGSTGSEISR